MNLIESEAAYERAGLLGKVDMISDVVAAALITLEARAQQAEAEAVAYRMLHIDLWKLIGRCDMAFEMIMEAKLLGPAKQTARQLRAEIRQASGGEP